MLAQWNPVGSHHVIVRAVLGIPGRIVIPGRGRLSGPRIFHALIGGS
jgi:hypothetical protein